MKKLFLLIGVAALLLATMTTYAQTAPTNSAAINAVPQLTPEAVAAINNLMCLLPAKAWPAVALVIGLIVKFGILGRLVVGWRNGGVFGVIAGLLGGQNTPKAVNDALPTEPLKTPRQAGLGVLFLFLLPACLLFTGCKSSQVVNFSKGTGLNAHIPIGYNGANLLEFNLKIGQFYSATAVQPVSTNIVYVPCLAFASSSDGTVTAPQIGGQGIASVTGGDKFTANIGAASGSISNAVGTAESSGK